MLQKSEAEFDRIGRNEQLKENLIHLSEIDITSRPKSLML